MAKFKVSFELDEDDAAYFRGLYRQAKQSASKLDADQVVKDARTLIARVRQAPHVPAFVTDAITTLEDMTQIILDEEYKAPQAVKQQVLAGLARLAHAGSRDRDETGYLDPVFAQLELGASPGSLVVERWEGEWSRSVDRLIEYARY